MTTDANSKKIFDEIKSFSIERTSALIKQVLEQTEKTCVEIGKDLDAEFDDKIEADLTLEYLRENSENIIKQFVKQSSETLAGEKVVGEANQDLSLTLSLVDDETLDEMILIGEITGKIQDRYEHHLKALKRGLVRLGKNLDFEPEPEAFSPKKLALLLSESLKESELAITNKKRFYDAFRSIANVELEAFYGGLLSLLQNHGIISESENPASKKFQAMFQYRQAQTNPGAQASAQPQPGAQDQQYAPNVPGGAPTGGGVPGGGAPAGGGIPGGGVSGGGPGYTAPAGLAPVAARAVNSALFNDSPVSRALYQYIAGPGTGAGGGTATGGPALPIVDSNELLGLLSNLQNQNPELAESTLTDASSVSQQITSAIAQKTKEWAKQVSGPERNVIELVSNLFVTILEDQDIADPVKVQIGRLQIPYIKVALLDVTLLNKNTHPARLLLNELAQYGVSIDDREDPLYDVIRRLTQDILDNFETDLNVFTNALNKLHEAVKKEQGKIEHAEKSSRSRAESQAKVLHIKKQIVLKLKHFLKGKVLPKELHALVLKGFAPLFLTIYRRDGEDSPQWKEATMLFRQIIESVQPRNSLFQSSIIVDRSGELLNRTRQSLAPISQHLGNIDLFSGLEKIYRRLAEEFEERQAQVPGVIEEDGPDPLDLISPDDEPTIDISQLHQPSPEELMAKLPPEIQTGTWCEVYMGRDQPACRLKVSSVLPDTAQLIFIDNTGRQAEIKDIQEFLDELDCERSRIISEEEDLFDKALSAVVANMNLMRGAAPSAP